jgi:hypothetical protein
MEELKFTDPKYTPAGPTSVCEIDNVILCSDPKETARINKARALMRVFSVGYQAEKKGFSIHEWKDEGIAFFVFNKDDKNLKEFFDNVVITQGAELSIVKISDAEPHLIQYRIINGMGTYCFDIKWVAVIKNILSNYALGSSRQYVAKVPIY